MSPTTSPDHQALGMISVVYQCNENRLKLHNRDGRVGHTKTTRVMLRYHGIEVESLRSCVPHKFG